MAARNRLPPWHEELRLRDGRELLIRPVRPDDAGPLREGFALLQPDEVRHRFLEPLQELTRQQADRLCRPDPRNEFALVAILTAVATGNPVWDAIGTIGIGVLLIVVAVFVAIEVKALLIGQSMDPERQRQVLEFVEARPEVVRVMNLLTLQLGNEALVSVQAVMQEGHDAQRLAEQIDAVERAMKAEFPEIRFSFFEPDVDGTGEPD